MPGYYTTTIGAAYGSITTGSKVVTTAGTAEQITASSIPMGGVWVSADTDVGQIMFVGDINVSAVNPQQGIQVVPGNPSIFIPVDNLNKLYVDANVSGGKLAYAYLQPTA